jgi:hypothetical protein
MWKRRDPAKRRAPVHEIRTSDAYQHSFLAAGRVLERYCLRSVQQASYNKAI